MTAPKPSEDDAFIVSALHKHLKEQLAATGKDNPEDWGKRMALLDALGFLDGVSDGRFPSTIGDEKAAAETAHEPLTPELLAEVEHWSRTPFAHDAPTPRVWREGDAEPEDHPDVKQDDGRVWTFERGQWQSGVATSGWDQIFWSATTLTEVISHG